MTHLGTRKGRLSVAALFFILMTVPAFGQELIASWTFEESVPSGSGSANGPYGPEAGAGAAGGFHASDSTTWSNPVGNGSGESYNSNNWSMGDYYEFQVSTLGRSGITVSWDQTRSSTGPADWVFLYSADGENFTTGSQYSVSDTGWSSTSYNPGSTFELNLGSATILDNRSTVHFRLAADSEPASTAGTARVDNFEVSAIPEPATCTAIFGGLALIAAFLWRNRVSRA